MPATDPSSEGSYPAPYRVTARNFSVASDNKIHSDEIAQRYGFRGALVPGVAVWGHLTYPVVQQRGASWLAEGHADVRFHKPAYDGDALQLEASDRDEGGVEVTCRNSDGVLLAVLRDFAQSQQGNDLRLPRAEPFAFDDAPRKLGARVDMTWDTVHPGECFEPWVCPLDEAENERYAREISDDLALYRSGVVHPHWLLSIANQALTREYVMPAWIHVGSEIRFHELLQVDDEITVRFAVEEKWERKGHQFLRTYGVYERGGEVATEVSHTAIFRVAG